MKWSALIGSGVVSLVVLLAAGTTCYALGSEEMTVKVPFAFLVNGEQMPAGNYTVDRFGMSTWLIRDQKGNSASFVTTIPERRLRSGQPELRFQPYEKTHRLTSIWEGTDGHELVRG